MGIFKKVLLRCGLGASVGCERISEHSTLAPRPHLRSTLLPAVVCFLLSFKNIPTESGFLSVTDSMESPAVSEELSPVSSPHG